MLLKYYGPAQVTKKLRISSCLATSLKLSKAREFISFHWAATATPASRGSLVAVLFQVHGMIVQPLYAYIYFVIFIRASYDTSILTRNVSNSGSPRRKGVGSPGQTRLLGRELGVTRRIWVSFCALLRIHGPQIQPSCWYVLSISQWFDAFWNLVNNGNVPFTIIYYYLPSFTTDIVHMK